jgi:Cytochrome bd terminal oxidase subunit I
MIRLDLNRIMISRLILEHDLFRKSVAAFPDHALDRGRMAAMFEGRDAEVLARAQFAFTMSFHIVFPAFSIGLASCLAVLEALWLWTAREVFINLFNYWLKIFAVAFGIGVMSGIVMSYQDGTNWPGFSDKIGPVIGPLMAYEVLAVAALLTAAVVAGLSAIVVAIQMRSARGRSSSQTAFTVEEEERSVGKPIVSAASVRAAPLVFDATRTPDAAAGGTEREEPCSA